MAMKQNDEKSYNKNDPNHLIKNVAKEKPKRGKCDLGPDFVAPDGGYGWLVLVAVGCSNLCQFPVLQKFGLLFRERLGLLGITHSQCTTIININPCVTSCIGLFNGPLFRRFTYRQVAICGSLLIAFSIYLTSISNSFITFMITFSILYGAGAGILSSANSLALNTYFKEKRRIATGLSWTLTGMGPIFFPQLIAIILPFYEFEGTLLIFTGIALNSVVCSLMLQPVQWHVQNNKPKKGVEEQLIKNNECDYCRMTKRRNPSVFSSQYLYNADNVSATGYEIIDPGVPMLSLANDGWSAKRSLYVKTALIFCSIFVLNLFNYS